MSEKPKDHLTTREAAKILGVAVSTIQLWTNNGLLQAWTTGGGHRRITRRSVEEMLHQQQVATGEDEQPQKLSIVLVEDDAQSLLLYKKQLLNWNKDINLITAQDGYQGLIQIGRTLPDIIITDLMMPNIDGFQIIKALKEMPELQHSLIIVITGLIDPEIAARGGLPDGVSVFTKPVAFDSLITLLNQKISLATPS